jgi:hypothetical protein
MNVIADSGWSDGDAVGHIALLNIDLLNIDPLNSE